MSRSPNDFDGFVDDFEKAKDEIRKKARKQLQELERRKKKQIQERYALIGEIYLQATSNDMVWIATNAQRYPALYAKYVKMFGEPAQPKQPTQSKQVTEQTQFTQTSQMTQASFAISDDDMPFN